MTMRKVQLKVLTEPMEENQAAVEFDYREIMQQMLRAGGLQGLTIGEMKDRLDALHAIDRAGARGDDYVLFTKKEYQALLTAKKDYRFRFALWSAIEFNDDVDFAPEVEEEEEK